jgi:hypothetical protein
MTKRDFHTHVTILGWINIAASGLFIGIGVFGFFFLVGLSATVGDPEATKILSFVGCAGVAFLTTLSLPGLLAGYGLLTRQSWARILGIIVAILDLFNVPIGTAIGIYALWVLTEDEAVEYFARPEAATQG